MVISTFLSFVFETEEWYMTEKEIKALLADMTLKEKIGQLTQLDASCFNDEGPVTGAETELGIPAEDFPYAGSVLGVIGARQVEKLQKMCMEKQYSFLTFCGHAGSFLNLLFRFLLAVFVCHMKAETICRLPRI